MDPEASSCPAQAGIREQVSVIVTEPGWRRLVPRAESIAARAAQAAGNGTKAAIVLAADRTVRRLNSRHRGRDRPTNVLTYLEPAPEIVLALGVIRREAKAAGRSPAHHLAHLVVHGVLHLAGHDHHHAGEARRMELAEARILHRLRVPNPWKLA
jgi:probable rRNA maturation factor